MTWRRSFDVAPRRIDDDDKWSQSGDVRYADLGDELPRSECLKDVIERLLPYSEASIVPDLAGGSTVLIPRHTATACAPIVKHLDVHQRPQYRRSEHPDRPAARLRARCQRCARWRRGGRYLDPEAAAAAAEAVANQGRFFKKKKKKKKKAAGAELVRTTEQRRQVRRVRGPRRPGSSSRPVFGHLAALEG